MGRRRHAQATATLERLGRQAVTLERLDILTQKGVRLSEAGVTYADIAARRNQANAYAEDGVHLDFNDALELLYDETFRAPSMEEER